MFWQLHLFIFFMGIDKAITTGCVNPLEENEFMEINETVLDRRHCIYYKCGESGISEENGCRYPLVSTECIANGGYIFHESGCTNYTCDENGIKTEMLGCYDSVVGHKCIGEGKKVLDNKSCRYWKCVKLHDKLYGLRLQSSWQGCKQSGNCHQYGDCIQEDNATYVCKRKYKNYDYESKENAADKLAE